MGYKLPPPAETPHIKTAALRRKYMEFLKEVLGEELFNNVKTKIDAYNATDDRKDKPLKLADLSGGGYVSADKFNTLQTETSGYKTQLETLNGELTTLKGKKGTDADTKASLDALQTKYDTDMTELNKQIAAAKLSGALEAALVKSGAKNTKALKALLDLDKIKLDNDTLTGLDDQLGEVRKENDYLFANSGAWADRSGGGSGGLSGVEEAFYSKNPDLRPKE